MKRKVSIVVSGMALFAMFFGASNLVFPLLLGKAAGTQSMAAVGGLFITAVLFPLLGLISIMLFDGDHKRYFGRLGPMSGFLIYLFIQFINSPLGPIPRLFTVAHGTLKHYIPLDLPLFALVACVLVLILTIRPTRIVDIVGAWLTPVLLASLALLVVMGLRNPPAAHTPEFGSGAAFSHGLRIGYNTLDLIASYIFAKLILSNFQRGNAHLPAEEARRQTMRSFFGASVIAALLLGITYGGLCLVAAFHLPEIGGSYIPEELFQVLAVHILGTQGALVASIAVAMACLTTAVTLTSIFADYLHDDLLKKRIGRLPAICLTLAVSAFLANLGFSGIMAILSPIMRVAYPALIVFSLLNILHKMRSFQPVRVPVAATLLLSSATYLL